jgi:hypothetical protein
MRKLSKLAAASCFLLALPVHVQAELRPEKVRVADGKKNLSYIRDGLFIGGDRAIDGVTVKDIRHAVNPGFERVVIDLEATKNGEPAAIDRAPYYQLAVSPDEKRLVFTVWGTPRLGFDPAKVIAGFQKSAVVQKITLLPKVEDSTWTFVMELKTEIPVEVFELSRPVRVILDLKVPKGAETAAKAHVKTETKTKGKAVKPRLKAKAHEKPMTPSKHGSGEPLDLPASEGPAETSQE